MDVDRRLEQLCERVTLVEGEGNPRRGKLCVMSFVALLAGEDHTDHPASASPLIRNFALWINDAMPRDVRQRLKPFAVRILGTNDGCDQARAEVLRHALAGEILPRIEGEWRAVQVSGRHSSPFESLIVRAIRQDFELRAVSLLARIEQGMAPSALGSAVGELLSLCIREAATPDRRARYWNEAMELLDRLCDAGTRPCQQSILGGQVERAEERLGRPLLSGIRKLMPVFNKALASF
ncbi:hypothetical protein E2C06_28835 [Dankookia rubra]|uniref:Uncharacterized protein n=1 Tax=Dankookia rubra TaxID=1442381 RepID=A0A4V3A9G7_9PROT|nr:hypothetical protein [Dankookia rubra]TDH59145.1 hypothetical protein E2C06_28835 [Dankookia rubra]